MTAPPATPANPPPARAGRPDWSQWRERIRAQRGRSRGSNLFGSFLATFVFVLIGTSVATLSNPDVQGNQVYAGLSVAIAFGLALFVGQIIGGPNAQVNPAQTLGMSLLGRQERRLLMQLPAQFAGAVLASLMVWGMFGDPGSREAQLGAALPAPTTGWLTIFLVEMIGTFVLVRAGASLLRLWDIDGPVAEAAIAGVALTALVFAALTVTGGSFNPARSFGPALVASFGPATISQAFNSFWLYILAQFAGGLAAAATVRRN